MTKTHTDSDLSTLADVCETADTRTASATDAYFSDAGQSSSATASSSLGNGPAECPYCDSSWISSAKRDKHVQEKHPWNDHYPCQDCTAVYNSPESLRIHVADKHGPAARVLCPHPPCGKTFVQGRSLRAHIRGVHQKLRPFTCYECEKEYSKENDLDTHIRMEHLGIIDFICYRCNQRFSREANLDRHLALNHGRHSHRCQSAWR